MKHKFFATRKVTTTEYFEIEIDRNTDDEAIRDMREVINNIKTLDDLHQIEFNGEVGLYILDNDLLASDVVEMTVEENHGEPVRQLFKDYNRNPFGVIDLNEQTTITKKEKCTMDSENKHGVFEIEFYTETEDFLGEDNITEKLAKTVRKVGYKADIEDYAYSRVDAGTYDSFVIYYLGAEK